MKAEEILKKGQKRLSDAQVRRYAGLDRGDIARELKCSTRTVRDVLNGREMITGEVSKSVLELAEKMVTK